MQARAPPTDRKDLREDINDLVEADAAGVQANGVEQILEWGLPPANEDVEVSPEITVFDQQEEDLVCGTTVEEKVDN